MSLLLAAPRSLLSSAFSIVSCTPDNAGTVSCWWLQPQNRQLAALHKQAVARQQPHQFVSASSRLPTANTQAWPQLLLPGGISLDTLCRSDPRGAAVSDPGDLLHHAPPQVPKPEPLFGRCTHCMPRTLCSSRCMPDSSLSVASSMWASLLVSASFSQALASMSASLQTEVLLATVQGTLLATCWHMPHLALFTLYCMLCYGTAAVLQESDQGHCKCVGLVLPHRFRIRACSSCSRVMSSCLSLKMPSISLQQYQAIHDCRQAP